MKRFAIALALVAASAEAQEPVGQTDLPTSLQLDAIPTGALVTMLMRDIMRVPYVISPDVLADRRPMSVKLVLPRNQIPERVVQFLRKNNMTVQLVGGTVYVDKAGNRSISGNLPSGSPVMPFQPTQQNYERPAEHAQQSSTIAATKFQNVEPEPVTPTSFIVYSPAHRSPSYLSTVIIALLPTLNAGNRQDVQAQPSLQTITPQAAPDLLTLAGDPITLERARRLIIALDRPVPMVAVKAVVMQVSDVRARGSALTVLANLAGGKIEAGSFGSEAPGAQFLRLGSAAISAMFSAVREDSRFKVVATPNLAALSGASATINAGSQVPTIGSVTYTEGGAPISSVVYRDSGITLAISPVVRGELIEMTVNQERSSFARTTTGVEDSPTLQKTSASASVVLKSGESVVLAGLNEETDSNRREGLLGGLLGTRSADKSTSELIVVLQAEIVPGADVAPGYFIDIDGESKPPRKPDL